MASPEFWIVVVPLHAASEMLAREVFTFVAAVLTSCAAGCSQGRENISESHWK